MLILPGRSVTNEGAYLASSIIFLLKGHIPVFTNPEIVLLGVKVERKRSLDSCATSLIEILFPGFE